ncbi:MAG TPA: histidine kinase N-terminal 7TM domain-containing protein [bacterium]|nr:histidine kinase N-terminal 7TM domain-containing protein [bacterium]
MTLTTIILIFALMLNSAIVYLVYRSNPRRLSNRIFAFLGINIGLWNLAFIFIINATTTQMASAWIRVTFILGSFVPLCFVALTYSIGEKKLEFLKKKGFQVVVLLSLIALFVSLLPNFFLDITEPGRAIQQVPHATYGWPFFVFFVLFLSGNIYGFIILIKKLKLRKGMARAELEYMIAGELFALFFVFFCNFLYPVLFKSSFLVQFSPLGVLIMNGIIGYGIAKYRILDISVVMEKTLSYSMVILFMFILYNMSQVCSNFLFHRTSVPNRYCPTCYRCSLLSLLSSPAAGR